MAKRRANGKKRRTITLQEKLNVVKQHENGQSVTSISRHTGFAVSTVCTILKDKDRIKYHAKNSAAMQATVITRKRTGALHEMEQLLKIWLEDHFRKGVRPSLLTIQDKARSLYNDISASSGETRGTFLASSGWFNRFKLRANLKYFKSRSAIPKDNESEKIPQKLADVINDGKYLPDQVIHVVETQLFWKGVPDARQKSSIPGFKLIKGHITVLLGANASGDFKLTPLVICPDDQPPGQEEGSSDSVRVIWKCTQKAALTSTLFDRWYWEHFQVETKEYCLRRSRPFRVCLVLETSSFRPPHLDQYGRHVKVVCIPPNAPSTWKPADPGMATAFKAHYLHRTFIHALAAREAENRTSLLEVWECYGMHDALKCIKAAWEDVGMVAVRGPWTAVCPQFGDSIAGGEGDALEGIARKVIELAPQLQLRLDLADVLDLVTLGNDPCVSVPAEGRTEDEGEESPREPDSAPTGGDEGPEGPLVPKSTELDEAMREVNSALQRLQRMDPDTFRMTRVGRIVQDAIACFKEVHSEKHAASLRPPHGFVVKVECPAEHFFSDSSEPEVKAVITDIVAFPQTPSSSLYDDDEDSDVKDRIHHNHHPFV